MIALIRKQVIESEKHCEISLYVLGICIYQNVNIYQGDVKPRPIGFTQYLNDTAGEINDDDYYDD